jgi:ribulose-5-phosphate 4-epimerase/fuculose-1-phosphate aldolase
VTAALRDEVCCVGASLHVHGYVRSSAGQYQLRCPDGGFLIADALRRVLVTREYFGSR